MKTCSKCGYENPDESVFCAGCGSPLAQADSTVSETPAAEAAPVTADEPSPQPTPVQTIDTSAYTMSSAASAPAETNKATLWLILNIVATAVCCCANIFGIVGIIFAAIGMSSYKKGNYEDMNKKAMIAKIMFIIAAVALVLGWIIAIVSPLLSFLPFLSNIRDITGGNYN